ncbi:unnamed protein product [Camellia sinensis]
METTQNPHKIHTLSPSQTLPIIPAPSLKPLTLSNSLKTSFDYEFEEEKLDKSDEPASSARLPVVIRRSGSVSRFFSYALQAMFQAIGIGYSRSLPSAAALNWVLKDGLGRLSRCSYTASLASSFDTNLNTAVHRSFAVADNLGEVSAKAQIQTVCFDSLRLMLAAALNILFRNNLRLQASLPFAVYPIFSAIDLIGIYQGWDVCIPSPADVSEEEGIDFMWNKGRGSWPIRIGCLNPKSQLPRLSMMTMQSLNNEDFYFICLEILCSGMAKTWQQGILLCVREGAGTYYHGFACHIRKAILSSVCKWESILEAPDNSDSVSRHWFQLIEDSK